MTKSLKMHFRHFCTKLDTVSQLRLIFLCCVFGQIIIIMTFINFRNLVYGQFAFSFISCYNSHLLSRDFQIGQIYNDSWRGPSPLFVLISGHSFFVFVSLTNSMHLINGSLLYSVLFHMHHMEDWKSTIFYRSLYKCWLSIWQLKLAVILPT